MTPRLFGLYWDMILTEAPMTDYRKAEFTTWESRFDGFVPTKHAYIGMRQRLSDVKHGIVREVDDGGNLFEETWKDGKRHGISREITCKYVYVRLYREDDKLAELFFDHAFKECGREDIKQLFGHVQVDDFKLKDDN